MEATSKFLSLGRGTNPLYIYYKQLKGHDICLHITGSNLNEVRKADIFSISLEHVHYVANAFAREEKRLCWTCETRACDQKNAFAPRVKRTCSACETHLHEGANAFAQRVNAFHVILLSVCSAFETHFVKDTACLLCVDQLLNMLACLKCFHVPRG